MTSDPYTSLFSTSAPVGARKFNLQPSREIMTDMTDGEKGSWGRYTFAIEPDTNYHIYISNRGKVVN